MNSHQCTPKIQVKLYSQTKQFDNCDKHDELAGLPHVMTVSVPERYEISLSHVFINSEPLTLQIKYTH